MCRMAAYVGAPRTPQGLLFDAPHALEQQAHAPRELLDGTMSVDGTGLAWWPTGPGATSTAVGSDQPSPGGPRRYADTLPPWADANLRELAPCLPATAMVAAVRGATPGRPHGRGAVAPFVVDDLAIAHNGWITGYEQIAPALLAELAPARISQLEVLTDSVLLALLVAERAASRAELLDGVGDALERIVAMVAAHEQTATLNLVVSDGRVLVGARASVGLPTNSLYVLSDDDWWAGGALLASEPLDDGSWQPVAPDSLVEVHPDGHRHRPHTASLSAPG